MESSRARNRTHVPCLPGRCLPTVPPGTASIDCSLPRSSKILWFTWTNHTVSMKNKNCFKLVCGHHLSGWGKRNWGWIADTLLFLHIIWKVNNREGALETWQRGLGRQAWWSWEINLCKGDGFYSQREQGTHSGREGWSCKRIKYEKGYRTGKTRSPGQCEGQGKQRKPISRKNPRRVRALNQKGILTLQ